MPSSKTEPTIDRLSARLRGATDPRQSVAWIVDHSLSLQVVMLRGGARPAPLPSPWRALQVTSCGDSVWVSASHGGRYRLFERTAHTWEDRADLEFCASIHADREGSVWSLVTNRMLAVFGRALGETIEVGFAPSAISFGVDQTVWAVGGPRRFGGAAIWRRTNGEGTWRQLPAPAAARTLAAAPDGTAWSVNTKGDLWRIHRDGVGSFRECGENPTCTNCLYSRDRAPVRDVSVDINGSVWVVEDLGLKGDSLGILTDFASKKVTRIATTEKVRSIAAVAV